MRITVPAPHSLFPRVLLALATVVVVLLAADSRQPVHLAQAQSPDQAQAGSAQADEPGGDDQAPDLPATPKGPPTLEGALWQLIAPPEEADEAGSSGLAPAQDGDAPGSDQRLAADANPTVVVVVDAAAGRGPELQQKVQDLGGSIQRARGDQFRASLPVSALAGAAALEGVNFIHRPDVPVLLDVSGVGSATSEGVAKTGANQWHAAGVTGAGVKVAILDLGFTGYTDSIASGNLPDNVTVKSFYNVTAEDPDGDITGGGEDHGTHVAEIVHDMAPGASLYLVNYRDRLDLAAAVDWLIIQNVDVINHSAGFFNGGRGDGTGPIADNVTRARNAGILWVNAIGNHAQRHWGGLFNDVGDGSLNNNGFHNFTPSDESNSLNAGPGDSVRVQLRWDSWPTTSQDYDLWLCWDAPFSTPPPIRQVCAASRTVQNGTQPPTESLSGVPNPPSIDNSYHIFVEKVSPTPPVDFDLFSLNDNLQRPVLEGSYGIPADSPDSLTVGATRWDTDLLEDFSSRGPNKAGRIKPDIAAPDCTQDSFGPTFCGTSGSSPHVAGAAALVLQVNPGFTPAQVQQYLESRALELGALGKDNQFGYGRLDLQDAPVDLALNMTDAPDSVRAGSNLTYTITVTNPATGADTATGVFVTAPVPTGTAFSEAIPPAAYDRATGVWTVGSLAATQSATLDLLVTVAGNLPAETVITNTAVVAANNPLLNPGDDTATVQTTVAAASQPVACGDVITTDTVLTNDLTCGVGVQNALTIGADNMVLDLNGHTLTGAFDPCVGTCPLHQGVLVDGHTGVTIRNGTVNGFVFGVRVTNGSNNIVQGITATNNSLDGLILRNSDNNLVENCAVSGNRSFGLILNDGSDGNQVKNCTFTSNQHGVFIGGGDGALASNNNTFNGVTSRNNTGSGIVIFGGSSGNQLLNNTVEANGARGIYINQNADGNFVTDNTISGNQQDGIRINDGSDNNQVTANRITNNLESGIRIRRGSHNNQVSSNLITSNVSSGIRISWADGEVQSENNLVSNNTLSGNGDGLSNFDLRDQTTGIGTAGTANNYTGNQCNTSSPAGLCVAPGVDLAVTKSRRATIPVGDAPQRVRLNAGASRAYVTNSGSNSVSVIDTDTHAVVATILVGASPAGLLFSASTNRLYVTNFGSDTVSVIDTASNAVVAIIPVGDQPGSLRLNPVTNRLYVENIAGDSLSVIDGATNTVIATIPLADGTESIEVDPTGNRIYVANRLTDALLVVDGVTHAVTTIPVGDGPSEIELGTNGRIYVSNTLSDDVSVIDAASNAVVATVPVGDGPSALQWDGASGRLYLANSDADTVTVLDGVRNKVIATIPVGDNPGNMSMNPASNRLYVANRSGGTISAIAMTSNTVVDTFFVGNSTRNVQVDKATNRIYVLDLGSDTLAVIADPVSPGGRLFYTVFATNGGPAPATGVVVTDTLPTGVTLVSATPGQGSFNNATGVWSVGSLGATESSMLNLVVSVNPGTPLGTVLTNTAVGTADQPDPNPANNTIMVSTTVAAVATLAGTAYANSISPANVLPNAWVQVCGSSPCFNLRTGAAGEFATVVNAGTYTLRVFPPGGRDLLPRTQSPFTLTPGETTNLEVVLPAPAPVPPEVSVGPSVRTVGGAPAVHWRDSTVYTKDVTGHCGAASPVQVKLVVHFTEANISVAQMMANTAGETWSATFAPFQPNHGPALLTFYVDCPGDTPGFPEDISLIRGEDETQVAGNIYVDPSGTVVDTSGAPVAGATVTLLRAESSSGPFLPVPDGSEIMSPSNRKNPDLTDGTGGFRWDVIFGYYRVRGEKAGCVSPTEPGRAYVETGALIIPPPVTNLKLVLECAPAVHTGQAGFRLHQDADGATGVALRINQVTGPAVPVRLKAYQAQLTYQGSCLEILGVREQGFITTQLSGTDTAGMVTLTVNGEAPDPGVPVPGELGHVLTRLVGGATQRCDLSLEVTSLTGQGGVVIDVPDTPKLTLQRGDALNDGNVNIADALFIAQYLVGLRPPCTTEVTLICLHPVNAASVLQDGVVDVTTIADALFIAQYLVDIRDEFFHVVLHGGITDELAPLGANLSRTWGCDAATRSFQLFSPQKPSLTDLTKLKHGLAYWLWVNQDQQVSLNDNLYSLFKGLNIIAWSDSAIAPGVSTPLTEALAPLGPDLIRVFGFDGQTKVWRFYDPRPEFQGINTLHELTQGRGYSVLVWNDRTVNLGGTTYSLSTRWNQLGWVGASPAGSPIPSIGCPSSFSPPHRFGGTVVVDGHQAADGSAVNALINGIIVATSSTTGGSYRIDVLEPESAAFDGKTINFTVDGRSASPTAIWEEGGATILSLVAGP